MPNPSTGSVAVRALPGRPNLEHLKNEAKQRHAALRTANPKVKLADAQFQLAREYGFASWRELKAAIDSTRAAQADPVGDWIGQLSNGQRIALHVRKATGRLAADIDLPDRGYFGDPVASIEAGNGQLCFRVLKRMQRLPTIDALYQAQWDAAAEQWVGSWVQAGQCFPLAFRRGLFSPAPVIAGLDGLWDGNLQTRERGEFRLSFGIETDEHGTRAWCDSPDGSGFSLPAVSVRREAELVVIVMKSATVEGELDPSENRIEARFSREGKSVPLTLVRRRPGAAPPFPSKPAAQAEQARDVQGAG